MSITKYINLVCYTILITICIILYCDMKNKKEEIERLYKEKANTEATLCIQTKQIQQNAINLEKYKKEIKQKDEIIRKKYNKVELKYDANAEEELKAFKELLKTFKNSNHS